MRSVKTVPCRTIELCRTQEWDFCYNPYSVHNTELYYIYISGDRAPILSSVKEVW